MYLEHFGLTVSPFGISPRLDFLYKSGAFEESMAHLVYGLDSSEAIVMITGAIGTGKTMAVQSFLSHLGERYVSALITNTSVDGRELLKLILDDLGAPLEPSADKSDLLIAFKKFLIEAGRDRRRIVIVIDEAQNLSREVLEEIRQLTNLGQGNEQPVQVVLVGQPELEANVARPDLAQLRQRIRVHYKLAPLTRHEVEEYVDHRMVVAGGSRGVFGSRALDLIYDLSGGVPRVVNTLCSDALLSAFVAGRRKVEVSDVGDGGGGPAPSAPGDKSVMAQPPEPRAPVAPARAPVAEPAPTAVPAPAPRRNDKVKDEGRAGMAVRRGRSAPAPTARSRRRGGVAWVLAGLAIVAIVALALTGRIDFLAGLAGGGDGNAAAGGTAQAPQQPAADVARPETSSPGPAAGDSAVANGSMELAPADTMQVADVRTNEAAAGADPAVVVQALPADAAPAGSGGEPEPAQAAEFAPVAAEAAVASQPAAADGEHYIHVSSFRTAPHAGSVAAKFTEGGLLAVVREQTVRDVLWYRVYLGPFGTHDDAVRVANRLRDEGTITYYKVIRAGSGEGL